MPSTLTWLDYDTEAHQKAQRIIRLFTERETRDELGIGPIRDAISDALFPGTSTIQTRLRYMLFVPWIYRQLEEQGVPSDKVASAAREAELELIECLLENEPDESGVIGREARRALKTLPSSIYWSGLGRWGLRLHPGSQNQYHRDLDHVRERRHLKQRRSRAALDEGDDIGGLWDTAAYTWHPGLPTPPEDFPYSADFRLRRDEARFLQDRLKQAHPSSLLAHLATRPVGVDCDFPWEHPERASFGVEHRQLLEHGRNFSEVHYGAALLYNLQLAEIVGHTDRVEAFRAEAEGWGNALDARLAKLSEWHARIDEFWDAVSDRGHAVGLRTTRFCEAWLALALKHRAAVFDDPQARQLVRDREIEKKKANSRFTNGRMRDQWSGHSGLKLMDYRWRLASAYVDDLAAALERH